MLDSENACKTKQEECDLEDQLVIAYINSVFDAFDRSESGIFRSRL